MSTPTDRHRSAGRPRWWVVGLSLCVLVASGLLAWSLARDDSYVVPVPHAAQPSVEPGAADATLAVFERAVRRGDAEAARALAPTGDAATADLLAALVHNAVALRVADFTLRYVSDDGAPAADGSWTASADVTWRFRGFDRTVARAEVAVDLIDDGDRVALTGFGGHGRVSPVWLAGAAEVRRTPSTLVVVAEEAGAEEAGAEEAGAVAPYAAHAAAAVPVVQRLVSGWHRGLVLEVPASPTALEQALGADAGTYDQIAAVTAAADGSAEARAPVHVFVNREVFDGLGRTGAQVVISHEATHVATGAWDSGAPLWLIEGFADYVALRDVALPITRSAAQIIAAVRADGPPRRLPGAAAFGTHTPRLGATYESAWLACRVIAGQAGEHALVAFYRAVDRGRRLGPALSATTGLTIAGLTQRWRDYLEELAG